jgi:hypothetical protein
MKISRVREPGNSGSLCQFIQIKIALDGSPREYPKIDVERDPHNVDHYFWSYSFKHKIGNKFVTRSKSVPRPKVQAVADLISKGASVAKILRFLE